MKQSVMGAQGGGGGCGCSGGGGGWRCLGAARGLGSARAGGLPDLRVGPPKQRMAAGRHPEPRSPESEAAHSAFSPGVRESTLQVGRAAGGRCPAHNAMAGGAPAESPLPRSHGGAWWG